MDKIEGRTYSLPEDSGYYLYIARQVDKLLAKTGGLVHLDKLLCKLVSTESPAKEKHTKFESIFAQISSQMSTLYTPALPEFLATLPPKHENQEILGISVRGYHLRMLHIEVLNRLMRQDFIEAEHKVLLLPHCLRDFRADECQFQPGEVDYVCLGCTEECQINQTGILLQNYPNYHLFVSKNMNLEEVFELARQRYKGTSRPNQIRGNPP